MKVLIELPTWLGDAVMTTPAINNLIVHFEENELTFIGSKAALEVMEGYPNVVDTKPLKKDFIFCLQVFELNLLNFSLLSILTFGLNQAVNPVFLISP